MSEQNGKPEIQDGDECGCCGKPVKLSPAIVVIVIHSPMMPDPYPLIPAEKYRVCMNDGCESVPSMIGRAVRSHPKTRDHADYWTDAVFSWADATLPSLRARMVRGVAGNRKLVMA